MPSDCPPDLMKQREDPVPEFGHDAAHCEGSGRLATLRSSSRCGLGQPGNAKFVFWVCCQTVAWAKPHPEGLLTGKLGGVGAGPMIPRCQFQYRRAGPGAGRDGALVKEQ